MRPSAWGLLNLGDQMPDVFGGARNDSYILVGDSHGRDRRRQLLLRLSACPPTALVLKWLLCVNPARAGLTCQWHAPLRRLWCVPLFFPSQVYTSTAPPPCTEPHYRSVIRKNLGSVVRLCGIRQRPSASKTKGGGRHRNAYAFSTAFNSYAVD